MASAIVPQVIYTHEFSTLWFLEQDNHCDNSKGHNCKKKTTHDLTLDKELQVSNSYWKGESVSSLTGFLVQSDYPTTYTTKSKAT